MNIKHHNLGMTLVELLFALALAAVLLSLAVPAYRGFTAESRLSSTTNLLVAHLNAARNEAVTRGEPVTVCVSVDESSCTDSTGWEYGWIMFTDSEGEPGVRDGDDELLFTARPQSHDVSLQADGPYVRFNALGGIETP